jgi:hypothetical protein
MIQKAALQQLTLQTPMVVWPLAVEVLPEKITKMLALRRDLENVTRAILEMLA